jgi:diadenosine tetraphosphate (Ap4A) HIT family hydrolase
VSGGAATCDFCREFAGISGHAFDALYSDVLKTRRIWTTRTFEVLPTLGPLTEGHLLLISREHKTSFSDLAGDERAEFYCRFEEIKAFLSSRYGPPVAFEHGALSPRSGGCGIIHAHVHVVPTPSGISSDLPPIKGARWRRLADNDWLGEIRCQTVFDDGYIWAEIDNQRSAVSASALPSQFMRQWLAQRLHLPHWDWREAGFQPSFVSTVSELRTVNPPGDFRRSMEAVVAK